MFQYKLKIHPKQHPGPPPSTQPQARHHLPTSLTSQLISQPAPSTLLQPICHLLVPPPKLVQDLPASLHPRCHHHHQSHLGLSWGTTAPSLGLCVHSTLGLLHSLCMAAGAGSGGQVWEGWKGEKQEVRSRIRRLLRYSPEGDGDQERDIGVSS